MLERGQEDVPIPDTGSLRSDLAKLGKEIIANLRDSGVEPTMRTVASIRDRDSPLAQVAHRFRRERLELAEAIVGRAIARGEISPQVYGTGGTPRVRDVPPVRVKVLLPAGDV